MGNPSDGYNGKTISIIVENFFAEVVLYEWEDVELIFSQEDHSRFGSIRELVEDVELHGYYGGIRLVKATIRKFVSYCDRQGHQLHDGNFSVRYSTNIPRQVGLAGSSAIVVATLRVLMEFYDITIPESVQPSLVLSVETEELGITAGLQDRVIQVFGGCVFMDFAEDRIVEQCGYRCGSYERIDPSLLPPLYIAYSTDFSEPTEVFHNELRARFDQQQEDVVSAMQTFAELAVESRAAIIAGDHDQLSDLIDRNFDMRASICRLPARHVEMVEVARAAGASAKFAGSGGAIIGTYRDTDMFRDLKSRLEAIGCEVFQPNCCGD